MYELNFIWVGANDMPASQKYNLRVIKGLARNCVVNVWCTLDSMDPNLRRDLESSGFQLVDVNSLLDRIRFPVAAMFIDILHDATLPSGLGDILKFLILTRPTSEDLPRRRFYLEADNDYIANLDYLVGGRDFMFEPIDHPETGETMSRPDVFFINTDAEACKTVLNYGWEHVEILLSDPIIRENLVKIIEYNKKFRFTDASTVQASFGDIAPTICKSLLLRAGIWDDKHSNPRFANRGRHERKSWVVAPPSNIDSATLLSITSETQELSMKVLERCRQVAVDINYWVGQPKDNKTKFTPT